MKCDKKILQLYAVTDRSWTTNQSLYQQVELALKGGVSCVQLREKDLDFDSFLNEAIEIRQLCKAYHVPFFINDNVEVAIACHADGIHVGQSDMQANNVRALIGDQMMLGVSVLNVEQAKMAQLAGADCLGVGAVFSTSTKKDADFVSYDTLKQICDAVTIPVVAIGGIDKHNMMQLKGTGIDGVALVSAIFAQDDIEKACKELNLLSKEMINN